MKKLITAALIWIAASLNVKAQESASAAQLITVELAPTIQITANNSALLTALHLYSYWYC